MNPQKIIVLVMILAVQIAGVLAAERPDPLLVPSRFPAATERAFWRRTVKVFLTRPSCCGGCQNSFTSADLAAVRSAIRTDAVDNPQTRTIWAAQAPRLLFMLGRDPRLAAEFRALMSPVGSRKEDSK